jgi:prepilin-type N-terminal cleavage/methylation domain-containing protein
MTAARKNGFTLVEMMIVVAILGVLAVIGGTAYRRYMDSGRTAEVYAMMGEFRNKEEAYRAEYSKYLPTGPDETSGSYFPLLLGKGLEPKAKLITTTIPTVWTNLGINPGKSTLYCGYVALAADAGVAPTGQHGVDIFSSFQTSTPNIPWWYLVATCDNDGDGNPNHNAYFTTAMSTTVVYTQNEHW